MTKDENFILDYYPKNRNIIVAGGMSGTGFKFALTIGKIVAKLAETEHKEVEFDLRPFGILRKINLEEAKL